MANHVSALKRARQTETRTEVNRSNRSRVRSSLRALREALAKGDAKAAAGAISRHGFGPRQERAKGRSALEHRFALQEPLERAPEAMATAPKATARKSKFPLPSTRTHGSFPAAAPTTILCAVDCLGTKSELVAGTENRKASHLVDFFNRQALGVPARIGLMCNPAAKRSPANCHD